MIPTEPAEEVPDKRGGPAPAPARIGVLFSSGPDRRLMTRFLASLGYESHAPASDEEYRRAVEDGSLLDFELLLVDRDVGYEFGNEILAQISTLDRMLPVLISIPEGTSAIPWLRKGFSDIIRTPIRKEELVARLSVCLRRGQDSAARLAVMNERLRRRNERLREAQRQATVAAEAKDQFLANISHELRTPIHGVLTAAAALEAVSSSFQKEGGEEISIIKESAESLLHLVEDLLDYSQLAAGKLSVKNRSFPLVKALRTVFATLERKAAEKGVGFTHSIDPRLPEWIHGDPQRIGQLITNLTNNALKFTDSGAVEVGLDEWEDQLRLQVSDTGPGIPQDKVTKIFQRFYQLDNSNTRASGGAGLGLAIVREIVSSMGGELQVETELGVGTTFRALLPLHEGFSEPPTPAQTSEHPQLKILLVEDNPINAVAMEKLLTLWKHQVRVARSGLEALEMAETPFDLIIMDVQMPGMTGLEATKILRTREEKNGTSPVPVLALTARARPEDRANCLAHGMTDFLAKPPRADVFREKITELYLSSRPTN